MTDIPTMRQREALQLRADGLTHQQAAHAMGIAICSFDDLIAAAKRNLEAKTLHHAIAIALRTGYIR